MHDKCTFTRCGAKETVQQRFFLKQKLHKNTKFKRKPLPIILLLSTPLSQAAVKLPRPAADAGHSLYPLLHNTMTEARNFVAVHYSVYTVHALA
jgi:hypothetical protein